MVRQEQEDVAERALAVAHNDPEDVVLNCFKMRDFQYIQPFMPIYPLTDREYMIQEGSVREINARKAKSKRDAPTTDDATPVNLQSAQAQPQQPVYSKSETSVNGTNTFAGRSQMHKNPLERVRRIG